MRHWIIVGLLSAGAFAAACTTTNVRTGGSTGAGNSQGNGGASGSTTATTGSGGPTTTSSTTSGTTSSTTSGTTSSTTSSSSGTGGATGYCANPRSGEDCSSCPNGQTCGSCCLTAVPNGEVAYSAFLYSDCGCAATSPCHAECSGPGDVCPGLQNPPSPACGTCVSNLSGSTQCVVTFNTDCNNDPQCALFNACLYSCP
jgi:hypothetical protein